MGENDKMHDNLIALLQIIADFQAEYDIYFDIWAGSKNDDLQAVTIMQFEEIATVKRGN